jgi:GDP-4-dehydro-6-deoxy-D-mannose reductase
LIDLSHLGSYDQFCEVKNVRALITGITGFAGGFLAQLLLDQGQEVFGVSRWRRYGLEHLTQKIQPLLTTDLRDPTVVDNLLSDIRPDVIYHLAGQAFVPTAWADPWATMENNIRPQLNILQAMVQQRSKARLLVVASNQVYGHVNLEDLPVKEQTPFRPENPYGVSKVAQDMLGLQYYLSHGLDVIRVRAFNHIGPRQNSSFVAASFAKQIAEIEAGLVAPVIQVGNLQTKRDFTDVQDVVRAYALMMERGISGEAYNVGTGQAQSIQHLLDILLSYAQVDIDIQRDSERLRPSDVSVIYADNTKLRTITGWEPTLSFEESLQRILNFWRKKVQKGNMSEESEFINV